MVGRAGRPGYDAMGESFLMLHLKQQKEILAANTADTWTKLIRAAQSTVPAPRQTYPPNRDAGPDTIASQTTPDHTRGMQPTSGGHGGDRTSSTGRTQSVYGSRLAPAAVKAVQLQLARHGGASLSLARTLLWSPVEVLSSALTAPDTSPELMIPTPQPQGSGGDVGIAAHGSSSQEAVVSTSPPAQSASSALHSVPGVTSPPLSLFASPTTARARPHEGQSQTADAGRVKRQCDSRRPTSNRPTSPRSQAANPAQTNSAHICVNSVTPSNAVDAIAPSSALCHALLECISLGLVSCRAHVRVFALRTLRGSEEIHHDNVTQMCEQAVSYVRSRECVVMALCLHCG